MKPKINVLVKNFAFYLRIARIKYCFFDLLYFKLYCKIVGVTVKDTRNSAIIGRAFISRAPGSKITIGEKFRFLSTYNSNLHGLKRPCMFSTLTPEAEIVIGNGCGMSGVVITSANRVVIGDNVLIGANAQITDTNSHSLDLYERRGYDSDMNRVDEYIKTAPICIGNDVFIGMNVVILKGSNIGDGAVIGANSVVSGVVDAFSIYAGNPAVKIKGMAAKV